MGKSDPDPDGVPDVRVEQGTVEGGPESTFGTDQFGASFTDKVIRAKFVRKVYAILLSQLAVTVAVVAVIIFTPAVKTFYCARGRIHKGEDGLLHCSAISTNGMIMYFTSYGVFFVTYFALACCEKVRKKSPGNLIAMAIFTISLSLMTGSIAVFHDVYWVLSALGITAALCLGLTLFSFQTKWDFTGWGVYLFGACWILFLFGILAIVFWAKNYPVVHTVYSALVALLFSAFLIYDTQLIMGGKKHSISAEEHVYAAVQLYVDVVYIFMAILSLGKR